MNTIKIYSPINDKNIKNNLKKSPIWKDAHHEDELSEEELKTMICYYIKFDNLIPIQVTKIQNNG